MTGSGTQADPYIVETFAEFDSVRNISTTTYIEYSNDEVDKENWLRSVLCCLRRVGEKERVNKNKV